MLYLLSAVELELSAHRAAQLERRLELARQLRDGRVDRGNPRRRLLNLLANALIQLGQELRRRHADLGPAGELCPSLPRQASTLGGG